MRGAPTKRQLNGMNRRIIPADAGSTQGSYSRKYDYQDHPRGCGEHKSLKCVCSSRRGSSPRMRGARRTHGTRITKIRIIPADAGSTLLTFLSSSLHKDHPRGCGEHGTGAHVLHLGGGSSPRMRGARVRYSKKTDSFRIIPADAGSTGVDWDIGDIVKDHPRGCGEHRVSRIRTKSQTGSSPRMRGAPVTGCKAHMEPRIIPADAGSTCEDISIAVSGADHPRGCGEHRQPRSP